MDRTPTVSDRIFLVIAVLILAGLGIDYAVNGSAILVFLGQKLLSFVDFLEFWN